MAKATMIRQAKLARPSHSKTAAKQGIPRSVGRKAAAGFGERKTIKRLAAEQGVKPTTLEDILGKGADLWESDQQFERFVEDIYSLRREDRELAKQ